MKIIIAGAGAVGFHLAELLAKEENDIILIDTSEEVLNHAATHVDVLTIKGDATSISVLQKADVGKARLFIAVTTSQTTNILSAILAKQMGVKKTIARVNNPEYLQEEQKENFFKLGVDTLISPQQLAAQEIERLLRQSSFTDIFEFEGGKISIVGFTIEETSIIANKSFLEFNNMTPNFSCRGIAILRNHKTIIPRGDTIIKQGDHMYMVVQNKQIDEAKTFAGKKVKKLKRVMIIGGSKLALRTAEKLEDKYSVSIVVNDKKTGDDFLETLHNALVIVADYGNVDILKEEGLERMDAFVALTPNSEINIITSLMAEEVGVYKTIALVDNTDYTHISQNIGIDTIINKKLIAANNIFRFVRKGNIQAIGGLHGVDAEVIEFIVHKKNRLLKHPIKNLHLPKKSIIAGVVRGNNSYIPDGDFQLEQNDKVIVFTQPEAIRKVEEIFK